MKLSTVRRIYQIFFLTLFIFLLGVNDFGNIKGYPTSLFLEIDPLVSITTFISSGVVYKGLTLSLIVIAVTLFFGRIFCSWVCPMGTIHHLAGAVAINKTEEELAESNKYRPLYILKYLILIAFITLAIFTSLQVGLLDPIAFTSRAFDIFVWPATKLAGLPTYLKPHLYNGAALTGFLFLLAVAVNRYVVRFWCRALCPLGALLGIFAIASPYRINRDTSKCNDCELCLTHCQGASDPHDRHKVHECHACMNCIDDCPTNALSYGKAPDTAPEEAFSLSRRKLIGSALTGAAFFTLFRTSVSSATTINENLIRPPGALTESDFLKHCIKCGQCMRVCPTNALHPTLLEAGIEGIWTPYFIMRIGYCEHNCTLCSKVCPTGAIREISTAEKIGKPPYGKPISIGTAFFDRGRCLPYAMDTECIVCEEVCPTSPKAIWFRTEEIVDRNGNKKMMKLPRVEPKLCIGCGICETKCPVSDKAAIRVTPVGETRSKENVILLSSGSRIGTR
jgi:MauM/NapG family ferredoxin protein